MPLADEAAKRFRMRNAALKDAIYSAIGE